MIQGLEWTFDTVAETYEKFRPGYPDELYQQIFNYAAVDPSSRVAEVGIGGGQAALPILKTGCALTAVEPGENLSKRCEKKFEQYHNFSVVTQKFENVAFPDSQYDLVYSASAFHWVPQDIGYLKVFDMLKSGGAFARFANHPCRDKGNRALSEQIDQLYAKYYCRYYGKAVQSAPEYREEQAAKRAQIAEKYGFVDIRYAMFERTRIFSAKEYVALLGTYSDHIAMEEKIREAFFSKIEEAIERYGKIAIYDVIDLQLARKP